MNSKYKTFSENCFKLANLLKHVPKDAHDQGSWMEGNSRHACGTSACAMGWAALSGQFEGLSHALTPINPRKDRHDSREIDRAIAEEGEVCTLGGKEMYIFEAAEELFGSQVTHYVFYDTERNKARTIKALEFFGGLYGHSDERVNDDDFIVDAMECIDKGRNPLGDEA